MDDQERDDRALLAQNPDEFLVLQYARMSEFTKLEGLGDHERSEVLHDAFLRHCKEIRNGKTYDGVPLRVVARNIVKWTAGAHRQRTYEMRRYETATDADDGWEPAVTDDTPGLEIWDLCKRLEGLPDKQRKAACLMYGKGVDHEEIAARMSMTRNAVDQCLHRARTRLKANWNG